MVEAWTFSSSQHANATANNAESHFKDQGLTLLEREETPTQTKHRPELGVCPGLGPKEASCFQSCWIVELVELMFSYRRP